MTSLRKACSVLALILPFVAISALRAQNGSLKEGIAAFENKNYDLAMKILRPLAEMDNGEAADLVGIMYLNGFGVKEQKGEAATWLLQGAANGSAKAQARVANAFFYGWGVAVDFDRSAMWMRRAADMGNAQAQRDIGSYYWNGFGVLRDNVEALKWFLLAIDSFGPGEVESQRLATVDRDQISKIMSPSEIADARKRADAWHPVAFKQTDKDVLALAAIAMRRDEDAKAARLYAPLAERGVAEAQTMLGAYYSVGIGVKKDSAESVRLYRLAAKQGDAGGQDGLALAYKQGDGVPKDLVRAFMWYELAATSGDRDAGESAKSRDALAKQLTPEQIQAARQRAATCRATGYKGCD